MAPRVNNKMGLMKGERKGGKKWNATILVKKSSSSGFDPSKSYFRWHLYMNAEAYISLGQSTQDFKNLKYLISTFCKSM